MGNLEGFTTEDSESTEGGSTQGCREKGEGNAKKGEEGSGLKRGRKNLDWRGEIKIRIMIKITIEEGEEEFAVVEAGLSRLLLFLHCKERMAHR